MGINNVFGAKQCFPRFAELFIFFSCVVRNKLVFLHYLLNKLFVMGVRVRGQGWATALPNSGKTVGQIRAKQDGFIGV